MGMRVRMRVALAFWMGGTNRMSRGQNEPARFNPFGANQAVGQFTDNPGWSAQQNNLQTAGSIQMYMSAGHHAIEMLMLEFGQPVRDSTGVMVIDQGDHANRLCLFMLNGVFNKGRTHQAAHGL